MRLHRFIAPIVLVACGGATAASESDNHAATAKTTDPFVLDVSREAMPFDALMSLFPGGALAVDLGTFTLLSHTRSCTDVACGPWVDGPVKLVDASDDAVAMALPRFVSAPTGTASLSVDDLGTRYQNGKPTAAAEITIHFRAATTANGDAPRGRKIDCGHFTANGFVNAASDGSTCDDELGSTVYFEPTSATSPLSGGKVTWAGTIFADGSYQFVSVLGSGADASNEQQMAITGHVGSD